MGQSLGNRKLHLGLALLGAVMTVCLMGTLALGLLQLWPPRPLAQTAYLTRLCFSAQAGLHTHLASWVSPALSGRTEHIRMGTINGSIVCGVVPWSPRLPAYNTWAIGQ